MRILYVVYWGALEQLGRSLVIPSVLGLAKRGAEISLVTFEKPEDLDNESAVSEMENVFREAGIDWIPLRYHKSPRIPAMVFDVMQGLATGVRSRLKHRIDIVHGRTFQAGLIGLILSRMLGAKFIYHNEGFYPDEQVDAGNWTTESKAYKGAKKLETILYKRSDAVFALTESSKKTLLELNRNVSVVPSSVDLERFARDESADRDPSSIVYLGSAGGRYDLARIGRFIASTEGLKLRVVSKMPRDLIALELAGLDENRWSVESAEYKDVPRILSECVAGIHFLKPGIGEFAGSPTKIGEYWAVGLPIVVSSGIGDIDSIIGSLDCGVVVGSEDTDFENAEAAVKRLIADNDCGSRCRRAAEEFYGLNNALETQFELYSEIV